MKPESVKTDGVGEGQSDDLQSLHSELLRYKFAEALAVESAGKTRIGELKRIIRAICLCYKFSRELAKIDADYRAKCLHVLRFARGGCL